MRNLFVDCLRGFCILVVLLLHYSVAFPHDLGLPANLWKVVYQNGYYGVTGFFVISGYLITGTSIRRYGQLASVSLRNFYWLRFCRIIPGLLLVLITLTALHCLRARNFVIPVTHSLGNILAYALTLRFNRYVGHFGPLGVAWDILWSLAIEEVFYLGFPVLCLVLRSREALLTALFAIFACGPFYRANHQDLYDYFACFDQIALGCITAILVQTPLFKKRHRWPGLRPILIVVGLALIVGTYCYKIVDDNLVFGPTGIAMGMACLLVCSDSAAATSDKKRPRRWLVMATGISLLGLMGRISYEIYLTHGMVIRYMMANHSFISDYAAAHHISNPSFLYMALIFAMILSLGLIFSGLYTNPVNHYFRKFFVLKPGAKSSLTARLAGSATTPE